jgi:hypothetical protein
VQQLFVDDSEYPFLVYGTIAGRHDLKAIQDALGKAPGYRYSGSTSGRTSGEGGLVTTYFSLNMIPGDRHTQEAVDRRVMLRLQVLGKKAAELK